ncbi:MAG: hypothetical protein BWZ10_03184 [candidate division BRC1 bacterium ADurb.BinA364]|nr:MAG: hypothetical protein BWZ10_03184 [candidate division BRC1 bacterium ADurb.BinA364]
MRAIALERQLAETRAELAGLQGKWPMRWARRAKRLAWLGAPVVFLLGLAGALAAWAGALGADRLPPRSPGQR